MSRHDDAHRSIHIVAVAIAPLAVLLGRLPTVCAASAAHAMPMRTVTQ
jgi:hypothetical protein